MVAAQSFKVFGGFFDDHVGDEDAVDASLLGGCTEILQAEAEDWIVVGEDDKAGLGALDAKGGGESEDVVQAGSVADGAFAGALNDGAIGDGIAEGDAEFEDVGAGIDGGDGDVVGGREVGVTDSDVGDETWLAGKTYRHRLLISREP
jgi:hypothetical protein